MKGLADQHLARHRGLPEGRRRQLFLSHSRRAGFITTEKPDVKKLQGVGQARHLSRVSVAVGA